MAKLHELLAVENDLNGQTVACTADLKNTFTNKPHHFEKKLVTFKSDIDGLPDRTESQLALQTTVGKELKWIGEKLTSTIDLGHQIDVANCSASADVVLDDGTILLKHVPATSLLRLKHRLVEIKDLILTIKTLDPAKGFDLDATEEAGVYRARDDERVITEKKFDFIVMVPPVEKHPAQVKELMLDTKIGTRLTQEWSSLITVKEKGDMLDRVEDLLRAVKKARSRANEMNVDVKQQVIGAALTEFLFRGNAAEPIRLPA